MAVLIISIVVFVALIIVILIKPSITIGKYNFSVYWIVPLIGVVALLAGRYVNFGEIWRALTASSAVNPLKILTLFLSMTMISIYLDNVGFFSFLANWTLKKAKTSQLKLFIFLYLIVSTLTIFTSNDIVILTFTPFICYFCKRANINPLPYLFAEFVSANTFSILLIIGNPTNIYLAQSAGVDFLAYLKVMWLPAIFAGVTAFGICLAIFWRKLKSPIEIEYSDNIIMNKPLAIIGLIHLILCTILLIVASYIKVEMWIISLSFAVSLLAITLVYNIVIRSKPKELIACVKRAPWELIPFVLSMFVIVMSLEKYAITDKIFAILGGGDLSILKYGLASALGANLMNNIPMSVLFSAVLTAGGAVNTPALFATIIGSNIGAYITPIGALAGIMWMNILKKEDVKVSFVTFVKYGVVIAIPVLLASLGGLYLSMMI